MINSSLCILLGILATVIFEIINIIKKIPIKSNVLGALLIIYLTIVLKITLFPIPIDYDYANNQLNNFVPFASIYSLISEGTYALKNILGNIVLFIPLGMIITLLNYKKLAFYKPILYGFIMSVTIEFLQFFIGLIIGFMYRSVDIDDVILNTLGAVFGFLIIKIIPKKYIELITE